MKIRWKELGIALLMAIGLWYALSGTGKSVLPIEVRLEYKNLPPGLVFSEGLDSQLTVRVSASGAVLRSLAGRMLTYPVDLSNVVKGENILSINKNDLPFPGAADIIDVEPATIVVVTDTSTSKQVPVKIELTGEVPDDYIVNAEVAPSEVTLTGGTGLIGPVKDVTVSTAITPPFTLGLSTVKRTVSVPGGLTAVPAEVTVSLHVGIKRKLTTVKRKVTVEYQKTETGQVPAIAMEQLSIEPRQVNISVAMPESLSAGAGSNKDIKAYVTLDKDMPGTYKLPVQVALPEGAELVNTEPGFCTVIIPQLPDTLPKNSRNATDGQ